MLSNLGFGVAYIETGVFTLGIALSIAHTEVLGAKVMFIGGSILVVFGAILLRIA